MPSGPNASGPISDNAVPTAGTARRSADGAVADAMASARTATSFRLVRIETLLQSAKACGEQTGLWLNLCKPESLKARKLESRRARSLGCSTSPLKASGSQLSGFPAFQLSGFRVFLLLSNRSLM